MKTAVYLRQSLDRDQTQLAVDRQREACMDLCQRRGWADIAEYVDNSVSASSGRRPEYEQLLADIESGAVGAVVAYHLDRLHRQPRELEHFVDLADRHHIALATVTGDVDLATAQGRLVARIMGAVARAEVEHKGARQKAAKAQRAQRGKAWNVRTFGYDGDELVWDEAQAVRDGCAALLKGDSLYGIAKHWNATGIKTTKGGTWTGGTVRQVLSRARNAGLQTYDGEIVEGVQTSWPAIVSRDTYDAVCAVLADPQRNTGKSRGRKHLLSGIAYCGLCGRKMFSMPKPTKKPGVKRHVYQCKAMGCMKVVRSLPRTDEHVVRVVTDRLARPDAAQLFARATVDTKALNKDANEIRALIKAAEDEYDAGIVTGRDLARRRDKLAPKLAAVEARLVGANTSRKLDGLLGAPDARERFDALPLDRQRAVIDTCAVVTVNRTSTPGRFDARDIGIAWR